MYQVLKNVDLKHLSCFLSAVESSSFSHAALIQDLSQPSLSTRIRQLEQAVGATLFHRHGRGVEPTPAARTLYERINPLVAQLQTALVEASAIDSMYQGEVVVGIVPTVAGRLSVKLAAGARKKMKVRVVESFSGHLQEWLLQGDIDIAVCTAMPRRRGITQTLIRAEPLQLVGPADSGPTRDEVRFRSLQEVPLILGSPQHAIRQILDQTARRLGVTLRVQHEVDNLEAQLRFVRQGLGYAILSEGALTGTPQSNELRMCRIIEPQIQRHLVVATYPKNEAAKPAVKSVAAQIARLLRTGNRNRC